MAVLLLATPAAADDYCNDVSDFAVAFVEGNLKMSRPYAEIICDRVSDVAFECPSGSGGTFFIQAISISDGIELADMEGKDSRLFTPCEP